MFRMALTIFVSAFLLFQIQPLFARYILPWFGGGAAVWAICLMFFQLALVAGYAYAYALTRWLSPRRQALAHIALLLVSLLILPITPSGGWKPTTAGDPSLRILALLVSSIGLPCVLIASTAPLLQSWFGTVRSSSPYKLYALSNLGSLLGLLTYPFLVEPLLGLRAQTVVWSIGYGAFVIACTWCAITVALSPDSRARQPRSEATTPRRTLLLWLVLPAFGVVLLLGATNELTKNIAPVPFLWVVPLALYSISYVICFANDRWYQRRLWIVVYSLLIIPTLWLSFVWRNLGLPAFVFVWCTTMFSGCMICHGELARRKPEPRLLTGFYLTLAVGGACGGVFVSVIAPAVFTRFWEVPLGLAGTFLLAGVTQDPAPRETQTGLVVAWVIAAAMMFGLGALPMRADTHYIASIRNFYGRVSVGESRQNGRLVRSMFHGRVSHGSQLVDPAGRKTPTLYYSRSSGVAMVVTQQRRAGKMRLGVIGLGAGTLASYGRRGDDIRFYEINPAVETLARRYFTYLQDTPAHISVVLGDARISLERELRRRGSNRFDILVLDAFNSEAIPTHLLTKEAFDLYFAHLAPGGALVLHLSNTYLELSHVVRNHARRRGSRAVLIRHRFFARHRVESEWVVVTSNESLLTALQPKVTPWRKNPKDAHWTDDYSNIFGVLKR